MSHLFPARTTWALSHEYVFIWVDLRRNNFNASKAAKNGQFKTFFLCHLFCRRRAWGRTEWRTCGRVMNAYITLITASCHTWISRGRAGKLGQLLLMSWIHTWSNHQSVILHIFCICPCFLSACSKFWLWKLVVYCHCTDLKRSVQEQVIWGDRWQIQQSIASKYALMTFLLKCYTCTHLILARTSYEFCNLGIILCIYI